MTFRLVRTARPATAGVVPSPSSFREKGGRAAGFHRARCCLSAVFLRFSPVADDGLRHDGLDQGVRSKEYLRAWRVDAGIAPGVHKLSSILLDSPGRVEAARRGIVFNTRPALPQGRTESGHALRGHGQQGIPILLKIASAISRAIVGYGGWAAPFAPPAAGRTFLYRHFFFSFSPRKPLENCHCSRKTGGDLLKPSLKRQPATPAAPP